MYTSSSAKGHGDPPSVGSSPHPHHLGAEAVLGLPQGKVWQHNLGAGPAREGGGVDTLCSQACRGTGWFACVALTPPRSTTSPNMLQQPMVSFEQVCEQPSAS